LNLKPATCTIFQKKYQVLENSVHHPNKFGGVTVEKMHLKCISVWILSLYTYTLSCINFEIWMPSHKDIIVSVLGKVNTNLNFVLHFYFFISVSGVTETQLFYTASPWNSSF
jgi:hypothetical protein